VTSAPGSPPAPPAGGSEGRRVLVFGSTGLVGSHLVDILRGRGDVSRVIAPMRRPSPGPAPAGVETPLVSFDDLSAAAGSLAASQVFLCLGTTMKKAGSREAFRRVDVRYSLEAARISRSLRADDAFLVTSTVADPSARNSYLRVKGEVEEALRGIPFRSVHVFRPSILTGQRLEPRPAERAGILVAGMLAPLMHGPFRRYRPVSGEDVARAMAKAADDPRPGFHVYESEIIGRMAAG